MLSAIVNNNEYLHCSTLIYINECVCMCVYMYIYINESYMYSYFKLNL